MQAFLKTGKTSGGDRAGPSTSEGGVHHQERRKPPAPWVEKYRPKNINDVVEQSEVVAVLNKCLEGADLPNMLLYGPPGTGKTSTILAAAHQLFGDIYKDRILELNASDERGIAVVRNKIKTFAQFTAGAVRPDGKPCPPFKIIILDEADSMTHAAQSALRRTMEKESRSTRFCLVCNYVSRIIAPIASRCTKFRFKSLREDKIIERLRLICEHEKVNVDDAVYKTIVEVSGGDLRRAITTLQSCNRLKRGSEAITVQDLLDISGVIPDSYLRSFLEVCKGGDYTQLENFAQTLSFEAYSVGQMLEQFNDFIVTTDELSEKQKALLCDKLGECSFRLLEGASEYLQIMELGCEAILILKEK